MSRIAGRHGSPCLRAIARQHIHLSQRSASTASFVHFFEPSRRRNTTLAQPTTAAHAPQRVRDLPAGYKPIPPLTLPRLLRIYAELSKFRLTILNVLPAMATLALHPAPTSVPVLLATAAGVGLCSASANTLNQLQEIPFDAQMARTRNRPLVRRAISPLHALGFASVTGIAGPAILWSMVNPTVALLGAGNIALYAGLYTALKRTSTLNTPLGGVVGAIPPLMGWVAGSGSLIPPKETMFDIFPPPVGLYSPPVDLSSMDNIWAPAALFMLLYSWQMPHFNGLAHVVRGSYAQAGYAMLAVTNPHKNALISLRHAALLVPLCSIGIPAAGLTTWAFALTSAPVSAAYLRAAWRFYRTGREKEARKVFQTSLWHLPAILALMMLHKQGAAWSIWGDDTDDDSVKEEREEKRV